jgi:hypothetical protein
LKTRIIYKGKQISRTQVKNNILKVLNKSQDTDRNDWYKEAHEWCKTQAKENNLSLAVIIGIVSAVSPMKRWDLTKRIATGFITKGTAGHTKNQMDKAREILALNSPTDDQVTSILRGPKTTNFYLDIMHYNNRTHVTIDRQAIQVAIGRIMSDKEMSMTEPQYNWFKECYIYTANILGIRPSMLQSITWLTWRKIK